MDSDGTFQPVKHRGPYPVSADMFNQVEFDPIVTTAIKVEIQLQEDWSAGVQEVVLD